MFRSTSTRWTRLLLISAAATGGLLLTTDFAQAQKTKFERTKPHVNVSKAARPGNLKADANQTARSESEWRYVPVRRFYNPSTNPTQRDHFHRALPQLRPIPRFAAPRRFSRRFAMPQRRAPILHRLKSQNHRR